MKSFLLLGALAVSIGSGFSLVAQEGGQRQGGPPPVFRTDVPESLLNVIAGAPTDTAITLSVIANGLGDAKLTFPKGPKPVSLPATGSTPQEVRLTGLKANTTYDYVLEQGDRKVEGKFTTARTAGKAFTFAIQADSHLDGNSGTEVYNRTLQNIAKDKPDFLVDLGDTFMVDKYQDYRDSAKQYVAQRYWFSRVGSQMSVFLCLGNHDGETGWSQRGGDVSGWAQKQRETYFPKIEENGFFTGAPKKGLYYAWNWGDATFIVLDPFVATMQKTRSEEDGWNWTLGETQFKWFEKTLKESTKRFKFVFIHHLVGGFGKEARGGAEAADRWEWGNEKDFPAQRTGWAAPIHTLMKRYGVTAMFHGHDHLYVREEKDGILYMEVPQPSFARTGQTNTAKEYGYSTGTLLGSSGHIRVTVSPKSVRLDYVKSLEGADNGKVVDSVEVEK